MGPMKRDECCSTFGRAWGSPCEACPLAVGDCPRGFTEINSECIGEYGHYGAQDMKKREKKGQEK